MLRSWGVRMRNVPKLKGRGWRATIKLMERQSLVNSFPEYSSVLSRSPALAVRSNSLQDFVEVTPPVSSVSFDCTEHYSIQYFMHALHIII